MKIFVISARSSCGTYFVSYLQELLIAANSKEEALQEARKWQKKNQSFVRPEKDWQIRELNAEKPGVIDFTVDSDY